MSLKNNIPFTSLDLQLDTDVETFKWNELNIEVKQYLPIEDKYDLITIALQESYENGHYNILKLDMYLHLYIVYLYTNLEFTEAERNEPAKLYDMMQSCGFIDSVVARMAQAEYDNIFNLAKQEAEKLEQYKGTLASVLNSFVAELPKNAQMAKETIEQFDPDAFQRVLDFAKAANGGRPIN